MNRDFMDLTAVKEILPHRDPMLLITGVHTLIPGASISAYFYADPQMMVFQGHFPQGPVLPGVYSVECMAQAADILLLSMERYAGKLPLFLGIDQVRFLRKIVPGETLEIFVEITEENVQKAVITCDTRISVNGELAAKGFVTLAMR